MKKIFNLIAICIIVSLSSCMERIDVGNVGLKVSLAGSDKGVNSTDYVNGYKFYMPFVTDIVEYNTRIQSVEFNEYQVTCKGGSTFLAHPKFNLQIMPHKAHITYNALGTADLKIIEEGYVHNAITKAMGDVANKYSPDSMLTSRERYESECEKHVKVMCDSLGIVITNFRANLTPPEALTNSIAAKQQVEQINQKLEQEKRSVQIAGEKQVIEAELAAKASIAEANGRYQSAILDAKANRELQSSYTDNFVKIEWIRQWDGKLPTTSLGANTPMINISK